MKKIVLCIFCACCLAVSISAQQITRFAVVRLPEIYTAFFRDSQAVREFEERSARVQSEIDRMTREIQELRSRRLDAVSQGDHETALRIESDIHRREEFRLEYHSVRTAELDSQRRGLMQSGSFLEQVHNEIRRVAEGEGYSMVFNLPDSRGILWHSPTVDITDMVIQNLLDSSRR